MAHDDPAPLSAKGLTRGRRTCLVLVYFAQVCTYKYKSFYMQTSEVKAYPKVGPFTGSLGVDALAVWVLLIYLSQTATTFT